MDAFSWETHIKLPIIYKNASMFMIKGLHHISFQKYSKWINIIAGMAPWYKKWESTNVIKVSWYMGAKKISDLPL